MKTFTAVALAAALVSSQAQAAFQIGWNKLYFANCLGLVTTGGIGSAGDLLWVFPDPTKTPGLTQFDTFSSVDATTILELAPFCKSGEPIYVHFLLGGGWDAISIYPGLK